MKSLVLKARPNALINSNCLSLCCVCLWINRSLCPNVAAVAGRYNGNNATNWPVALLLICSFSAIAKSSIISAPLLKVRGSKHNFSIDQTKFLRPSSINLKSSILELPITLHRQSATASGFTSTNERKSREPKSVLITSAFPKGLFSPRSLSSIIQAFSLCPIYLNWSANEFVRGFAMSDSCIALITANNLLSEHCSIHSLIRYNAIGVGLMPTSLPFLSIIFLCRYFWTTLSKSCTITSLFLSTFVIHFVVATNSNSLCKSSSNPM